jgi:hypothetical protein
MKFYKNIIIIICFFIFSQSYFFLIKAENSNSFNKEFYIGPIFSFSKCFGSIDVEAKKTSILTPQTNLFTIGANTGLSLKFNNYFKGKIEIFLHSGNCFKDTLYTQPYAIDKYYYYYASLEPSINIGYFEKKWNLMPFFSIGGGVNLLWLKERTFYLDNQEVIFIDRYYVNNILTIFSIKAGIGFDIRISSKNGINIITAIRMLGPITLQIQEDYPLYAMKYKEWHYGNLTSISFYWEF